MNMPRDFIRWTLIAVFPFFLLGCSTPDSRIRKNPHLFNSLTESQKEQVREGRLSLGDTENMVFLALGRPDRKTIRASAKGKEQIWIYTGVRTEVVHVNSHTSFAYCGGRRGRRFHPHGGISTATVYHQYDAARIVFEGGVVTSFEAPQR